MHSIVVGFWHAITRNETAILSTVLSPVGLALWHANQQAAGMFQYI